MTPVQVVPFVLYIRRSLLPVSLTATNKLLPNVTERQLLATAAARGVQVIPFVLVITRLVPSGLTIIASAHRITEKFINQRKI